MLQKIENYITEFNLANKGTPILVACSGGIDSMALVHILKKLNYKIGIAHCNFQLRDAESDADELFVEQYAQTHQIPFFSIKFDTTAYKKNNKQSTQMAARELRYEWFETIRKNNNYHSIATAHHLDDQIETILLNIAKGTGIKGLNGIKNKSNFIIRPLLGVSKKEILEYVTAENILYREDSSNASDYYQRNKIRHHITPKLLEINTNLYETISDFASNMQDYQILVDEQLNQLKKKYLSYKNEIISIKINGIRNHKAGKTILFLLLNNYGFNKDQIHQIFETKNISKQFLSESHRIITDRTELILTPIESQQVNHLLFEKLPPTIIYNSYKIQCSIVPIKELHIKNSQNYAYIDYDKLEFPLTLRQLKDGDYFYPFGIGKPKNPNKVGKKKIGKYFRDEKLNLLEKETTPILFSDDKAVWLLGHRIDDRFKITEQTQQVVKFKILKG